VAGLQAAAVRSGVGGHPGLRQRTGWWWRRSSSACSTRSQATGPTTVAPLADALGASAPHLASLLRRVVALGLLDQVDDVYELNETAERYLVHDGPASMAGLVGVAPGPLENWVHLADTVRKGEAVQPIENAPQRSTPRS
jgi:hypothetical protein